MRVAGLFRLFVLIFPLIFCGCLKPDKKKSGAPVPYQLNFSEGSQSVPETVGTVTIIITLAKAVSRTLTIPYSVSGTADSGDHNLQPGGITLGAGKTAVALSFDVVSDSVDEGDETIIITLSPPSGIILGGTNVHTITILGQDSTEPDLTVLDSIPDPFSFNDQANLGTSATVTSNTVTLSGFNQSVTASVSGQGSPSLLINGSSVGSSGTVNSGNTIAVRLTSSASVGVTFSATVTISGVSDTFSASTMAADTTPNSFTLNSQNGNTAGTQAVSNTVTISGINAAVTATVSGSGSPSIIKNGTVSGSSVSFSNGDTLALQMTASTGASASATSTVSIGGVSVNFQVTTSSATNGIPSEKFRLMVREDPSSTVVIGWNSISGSVGGRKVYYDTVDRGTDITTYGSSKTADTSNTAYGMNNAFVRLTGLSANTAHYFVVADSNGFSRRYWFKTLPNVPTERLSIIAGGDSRNNRTPRQNANKLVAKLRPHAVLFGGDYTEAGNSTTQWQDWLDDWQLTIASDGRMFPFLGVQGNHENPDPAALQNLFDIVTNNYYALNLGGSLVRVYALNSEISQSGTQATWLEDDLISNIDKTWKFAFYHRPMRPHHAAKTPNNTAYNSWASLFYNYRVNLVIESDAHVVKSTYPVRPYSG